MLDVALAEDHPTAEDPTGLVMRAIANIMMGRVEEGLADLANPSSATSHDAQLWRALGYAKQGRWAVASENFAKMETAIGTLPIEFQRKSPSRPSGRRSKFAISYRGRRTSSANSRRSARQRNGKRASPCSTGRLAEGTGRTEDAIYLLSFRRRTRATASLRRAAAFTISLRFQLGT